MSGENKIDALSEMLGRISADITHVRQKTETIDTKVDILQEHNVENRVTIKAAHRRLDNMEATVKDHERLKNKGMGIVSFVGFVFGVLGAAVTKIFHLWN